MGHCFLVGSKKNEYGEHRLEVLHYIEYLTYNLENKRIDVWADFIIRNISKEAACLWGLHSGNIRFQSGTAEWFKDTIWTEVLLDLARDEMGLVRRGERILLCEFGSKPISVELLYGALERWGPEVPNDEKYVCFTGWKSPNVKPGDCNLFRVCGTIEGETYDRLMPKTGSGKVISIIGGVPLQEHIRKNLTNDYEEKYSEFEKTCLDNPAFYHVFFERVNGQSLKTIMVSPDIRKVYVNKQIRGGRFINWFWSDSDFNVCTQANGPLVEMTVTN